MDDLSLDFDVAAPLRPRKRTWDSMAVSSIHPPGMPQTQAVQSTAADGNTKMKPKRKRETKPNPKPQKPQPEKPKPQKKTTTTKTRLSSALTCGEPATGFTAWLHYLAEQTVPPPARIHNIVRLGSDCAGIGTDLCALSRVRSAANGSVSGSPGCVSLQ